MAKKIDLTFEEKYDVVGVEPGIYHVAGFGIVDLTKLDVVEADHLFKQEFPFLKLKSAAVAAEMKELKA